MQAQPALPGSPSDAGADSRVLARGRLFIAARLPLLLVALVAVTFSFAGQPALYHQYRARALSDPATVRNLTHLGLSVEAFALYLVAFGLIITVFCFAVAALIAVRRADQPMALFVALLLVLLGATFSGPIGAQGQHTPALAWLNSILSGLSFESVFLLLYLFPEGRFAPRWTRWLALASLLLIVPAATFPSSRLNPDHWPAGVYALLVAGLLASGVFAQVYRYRRFSEYVARQQTKWVILGFSLALSIYLAVVLVSAVWSGFQPGTLVQLVGAGISAAGILLIPASFGVAILRYHLWNIDVLIGRTLVYGSLTAILSGLYAALVGLFQRLFLDRTGSSSNLAIVLTTLVVAASFTPIKNGVQVLVDRRYKPAPAPASAASTTTPAAGQPAVAPPVPEPAHRQDVQRLEELTSQLALLRDELATRAEAEYELRELIARLESRVSRAQDHQRPNQ